MYNDEMDFYQNYDADSYIHFRSIPTGEYELVQVNRNGKNIMLKKPITRNEKITFEDVKALNLDDYGQDARTATDDFTLVHNYLIDFWGAIMGSDAVMLYVHLKRYCFAGKDFCFPNMTIIREKMKKGSKATINKNMDILEEYGFIAKIQRYNKNNENRQASPFFKVRRYIPLLTQDLIEQLPETVKKEHEKFLARANGVELNETFDSEAFIKDLMKRTETMQSKKQKMKDKALMEKGDWKDYILSQLSPFEKESMRMMLTDLAERISKPSFETWFKDTIIRLNTEKHEIKLYAPNYFAMEFINSQYKQLITNTVQNIFQINVVKVECVIYEDFKQGE